MWRGRHRIPPHGEGFGVILYEAFDLIERPAATGREALIEAISRVGTRRGKLFHTVHIGKPGIHTPAA